MKTLIIATIVSILTLGSGFARVRAAQPQMNEAIEQLEKAKKSEHPVEHLEKAKHHLQEAKHDKGGERVEAIKQINEALAAHKKGEHKRMEEHIERAIRDIREGKHEAKKK
jgi:biopolymer transport protein ExbB/TolQ